MLQVHSLAPPAQPKRLCVSLTPSMRLEGSRGTPRDGRMYRLRLRVESDMQLFGEGVGRSGRMGARHGRPPHQLVIAFALARRAQREGRSYSKSGAESCSSASHPHARSIIKRRVQDGVGQQDQDAQGAVPQLEGVSRLRGCWMCPYLSSQNGMVNGRVAAMPSHVRKEGP